MSMHKGMLGRVGEPGPGSVKTLGDYVATMQRAQALDDVATEKKQTFDEWFVEYNKHYGLPPAHVVAEAAWNAALDNGVKL